jgi:H+/Cl- antiporter ClcA
MMLSTLHTHACLAAILYWADTSQLVQSGSERFGGRAFPAFTIGSTLGELIWEEIRRGTEVRLCLCFLGGAPDFLMEHVYVQCA